MYAQEVHQLYLYVMAVGGQEMNLPSLSLSLFHQLCQLAHGGAVSHAALGGQVSHAVHLSEPYDVLDVDVVADEVFLAFIGINHAYQAFAVLAEIIQEATVLTELVNVGGIVHG